MRMDIASLTDDELWDRTRDLARDERAALCEVVAHLAELDRRGLHRDRGFSSLFEYCVGVLRCSEAAAYRRIRAARAVRTHPSILDLLRSGRLHLEAVALLHPFLQDPDAEELVAKAAGLRTWEVQALVAPRRREEPRRDVIRFCPPSAKAVEPLEREPLFAAAVEACARPERPPPATSPRAEPAASRAPAPRPAVRVSFTADDEFYSMLLRARALLRHKYPDGRLEGVLKDALSALLKRKDPWLAFARRPRGTAPTPKC
jgi:hypothetical protein